MKLSVKILSVRSIKAVESYWQPKDYMELLSRCDYTEAEQVSEAELKEMLFMAITDFEPDEAAKIVLDYKLAGRLKTGQIEALSHEMIEDKVAEEYPDPTFHYDLFNINQLLHQAFNGVFPNTEASLIEVQLVTKDKIEMSQEVVAKALKDALKDNCILKRLYADQLEGKVPFADLAHFIWDLTQKEDGICQLLTSKYWLEKDDIINFEYETEIIMEEDDAH